MRRSGWVANGVLGAVVVALYAPLCFLLVASVNENPASTAWLGFTTEWYRAAWNDQALRRAVGVSVRLALGTSVLAVVIGTAAVVAVRRSPLARRAAASMATLRIATPEIILATGLGAALPAAGITFGFGPMLIAHVAYLTAYVVLIVGARAAGADRSLEEAALDLGARPWQILRDVVLPDLRPAIASAGLLTLAFSFDDVALSLALRGPDDTTVPLYIFSAVQRRVSPSIHAIGSVIVVLGVVTFVGAALANRAITRGGVRDQARP